MHLNNVAYAASKQLVRMFQPCGYCGGLPPYMCPSCVSFGDDTKEPLQGSDVRSINSASGVAVPPDFIYV